MKRLKRGGGLNSTKCLLYGVNVEEVEKCRSSGDWEKSGEIMAGAGRRLEKGGACFLVICTNTMRKVAVAAAVDSPVLHISDITAEALLNSGIRKAFLL